MIALTVGEWWTLVTACVCGAMCALAGCYLVLRKMSLLGDAITHAILPGLAGAFLLTGTREPWAMLLGALAVGLVTASATSWLSRVGRVPSDAALGVVFPTLFAAGVLLISLAADKIDLDPGCVLYGMIEFVDADRIAVLGVSLPRAFVTLSVAMLLCVGLLGLFWKEVRLVAFDAGLATSMGFSAAAVHYCAVAVIAGASVASFEAVGSILVVAMLVGPAATASVLTQRYERMFAVAAAVGVLAAALGTVLAVWWNVSVAGCIALMTGVLFALAVVVSPSQGLVASAWRRAALALRVRREDLLGTLYREHEAGAAATKPRRESRSRWDAIARWQLRTRGMIEASTGRDALTKEGLVEAQRLIGALHTRRSCPRAGSARARQDRSAGQEHSTSW
jgi:manganese/zinc/iron transport system permease protein